jgi:type IV secretion system protein VirB10
VGEYSSEVQYGQSRVFAVWQRIVFPDGAVLALGAMPGSSGAGYAGFSDRVNNHYVRIFGSAIMMSGILAGVSMTQDRQDDTQNGNQQRMSDALSESLGQVLGGVMAEMLSKNMSIAPTLEIRPGYRFNVMLVKDLEFKRPYRAFDYIKD